MVKLYHNIAWDPNSRPLCKSTVHCIGACFCFWPIGSWRPFAAAQRNLSDFKSKVKLVCFGLPCFDFFSFLRFTFLLSPFHVYEMHGRIYRSIDGVTAQSRFCDSVILRLCNSADEELSRAKNKALRRRQWRLRRYLPACGKAALQTFALSDFDCS